MNEDRYQELLGCLLDDELDEAQAGELAGWLRANPAARSDVRRNLFLWEFYSQQRRPERSVDAFAEACQTRILAENDEHTFVEGVELRLRQTAATASATADRASSSFAERLRHLLFSLRWVMSGAVAVSIIALCIWLFPATNNEPTLNVAIGTRVTLERGSQSFPAQDGLKLLPGDLLRISGSNGAAIDYGKENTRIALNDYAELKTLAWQRGKRFELRQGKLEAVVARQRPLGPMVLVTSQAEARVLGTEFTLVATTNTTRLDVTDGKVKLTRISDGEAVKVPAGHYAVAANGVELAALPSTGRISREVWTNYPGAFMAMMTSDPVVSERPNDWEYLTRFETPARPDSRFGQRVRGYVHPSITGDYRFSIDVAGLGEALLFLSLDEHPENRTQIHFDETRPKLAMNDRVTESALVTLVAGRKYYIEALHESVTGRGQFTVRWRGPGREREVIPGESLSPVISPAKETKR